MTENSASRRHSTCCTGRTLPSADQGAVPQPRPVVVVVAVAGVVDLYEVGDLGLPGAGL